jgi:hypothetical protein
MFMSRRQQDRFARETHEILTWAKRGHPEARAIVQGWRDGLTAEGSPVDPSTAAQLTLLLDEALGHPEALQRFLGQRFIITEAR